MFERSNPDPAPPDQKSEQPGKNEKFTYEKGGMVDEAINLGGVIVKEEKIPEVPQQ